MRRRLLGSGAGLLISLVALGLLVGLMDVQAAVNELGRAEVLPLLGVAPVLVLQLTLRTFRWRLLLQGTAASPTIPIRRLLPVLLIGYLANAVLPARLGEPIRAYLAGRREHIDAAESFGIVILERILDTASLAAVALVASIVAPGPTWLTQALAAATVAGVVVVGLLVSGLVGGLSRAIDRRTAGHEGVLAIPARLFQRIALGADGARRHGAVGVAIAVSVACWLLDATTFWLVGQSVGVNLSPAGALLIAAVTVLGTALPAAPGYLGTFDLAAAATATALGVPAASALALAVLAHVVTVLPAAAAGALAVVATGSGLRAAAAPAGHTDP